MVVRDRAGIDPSSVAAFLEGVDPPQRQAEARRLDVLFRDATGFAPCLHAGGILGYGQYAYTYDSGHSGVSPATGFAPRKAEISLYVLPGFQDFAPLLSRLGPHRTGKACLYINHLDKVDEAVLRDLIAAGLDALRTRWVVTPA